MTLVQSRLVSPVPGTVMVHGTVAPKIVQSERVVAVDRRVEVPIMEQVVREVTKEVPVVEQRINVVERQGWSEGIPPRHPAPVIQPLPRS